MAGMTIASPQLYVINQTCPCGGSLEIIEPNLVPCDIDPRVDTVDAMIELWRERHEGHVGS